MKKLLVLLFSFGLLTFMAGCPGKDDAKGKAGPDDAKLEKAAVEITPEGKATVAVEGKDLKVESIDPKDKGVKAEVKEGKVVVEATKEAEAGKYKITVKGKGKADILTVTVKKAGSPEVKPVDEVKAAETEVTLEAGKSVDVKLSGTKAETVKVDPEDKGVTAKIDGDKVVITADKEKAADKATFMVKVMADKAAKAKAAEIKVIIKK